MNSGIKKIRTGEAPTQETPDDAAAIQSEIDELLRRADEARRDGLWTIAAEAYSAVLELAPDRGPIWVQYGHMLKEAGKREQAQEAYEKALGLEPGNADTHLQLGHLFKLLENQSRAVEMYRRALEIDPMLTDATDGLEALGVEAHPTNLVRNAELSASRKLVLYFDITDLLVYFRDNRTPTGIQRISLAVTGAGLAESAGCDVAICAVDTASGSWKLVDTDAFKLAMALAREGADRSDEQWQRVLDKILSDLSSAPALAFPPGSTILNLGSPWGVPNYFIAVREAKRQYGVFYVAFVHDTIPLLLPEFCEDATTNAYTRWIAGVSLHADLVLANAQNTKKDFIKAIVRFSGRPVDCEVINPNGDFSLLMEGAPGTSPDVQALLHTKYALFVGTIEPRKNHLMVLSAWRRLLAELGSAKVPTLIIAGKMGWHSEHVTEFIRKTDYLDGKLKVLNAASDADLQALYQNAAFTVYNSHYEGWGLPVTESLSYKKVPVVARNSALTESGGKHAIFFDSNSEASFLKTARNLLTNPEVLARHEKLIRTQPPVRPWHDIYVEIERTIAKRFSAPDDRSERIAVIDPGRVYWLGTDRAMRNPADFARCEAARAGNGWHTPEEWGCWSARRTFQMMLDINFPGTADDKEDLLLHIQFRGHREHCRVRVELNGEISHGFMASADRDTTLRITFKRDQFQQMPIVLTAEQSALTELAKVTEGRDMRSIGVGLKAFMICRESDLLSRIRFMEEASLGYATAVAGVTDIVLPDIASLNETITEAAAPAFPSREIPTRN
jgi:glycosyltransferase involved in cell wall biosynthesis